MSEILDKMIQMIVLDCYELNVDESKIQWIKESVLLQNGNYVKNGFTFFYDSGIGYCIREWKNNRCDYSFGSFDELRFRFLFLEKIVFGFDDISDVQKADAEKFIMLTYEKFGRIQNRLISEFKNKWPDFCCPDKSDTRFICIPKRENC